MAIASLETPCMLRIIQNTSVAGAKSYYTTADYYLEGQEQSGVWRGAGANRLGLSGSVQQAEWDALCENRNPQTGEKLTLRTNGIRRVGYDFNFHVPKSVSLLYAQTNDSRVLDAIRDSVRDTMSDIESEMQTRVRKDGGNEDRTTGNMVWGEFVHLTSRPVEGVPDPQAHVHCFVFNSTWDAKEGAWKAGQFAGLKRDAPYFQALYLARLADRLRDLGLEVERTKSDWTLKGLDKATLDKFSRRTLEIEAEAKRRGVKNPKEKAELGAKTRKRKQKHLTLDELRTEWDSRLTTNEWKAVQQIAARLGGEAVPADPAAAPTAVARALSHGFTRKSVVPERTLLADALRRSAGQVSADKVIENFQQQNLITAIRGGRRMATTREVLKEEMRMIDFARRGRGTQRPLSAGKHQFSRDWLNADQRRAVEHVLHSRDRVLLIRGAAGVGKTSMMQEAVEGIRAGGHEVFAFAPSADASRGTLREAGFPEADTVATLLEKTAAHEHLRGQVIWIDECGQLGTPTLAKVFDLAEKIEARVILSGDRRQHGSVERGAALRLLETEAGIVPAEIKEIQRQRGEYKQAVADLSEGRIEAGFRRLDDLGWVREMPDDQRDRQLADDYVESIRAGKSVLVVSPTHREGNRLTSEIRDALQREGLLGIDEQTVTKLENLNLTEAERADRVCSHPGDVLEFHQNAKGFVKGQRLKFNAFTLPSDQSARFQAFRASELTLAAGDLIRITKNGSTLDGQHRLNNGSLHRVRGFDDAGNLILQNGWGVSRDFGHLTYGYVTTSHASQGKTVDRVLIGQSSDSVGASSREQFYVSVSRAREQTTIYTDDKETLLAAVHRSDDRLTATELVTSPDWRWDREAAIRRELLTIPPPEPMVPRRTLELEGLGYDR